MSSNGKATGSVEELTGSEPPRSHAVRSKRTSVAIGDSSKSAYGQVKGLFNHYSKLGYLLPWESLDYIELLAEYNPDYSQAVDNIKTLANSGHELFVEGGGKRATARIKALLEDKARNIQKPHGGIDGLIDKLLSQGATFGAMAGEWVLNEDLTDVIDFADVNPKSIRYFWGEKEQRWLPFQKVNAKQAKEAKERGQEVRGDCIRLNELTFHYFAFGAPPGSPYGTPPFLAALANIAIQRDMIHNMSQIVKKVGLLGIIDMIVKQLPPKPGESDEQYIARAEAYLDDYAEVVEDMVREGGVVHYDDVEVKATNVSGNAAGATNIFKQNEELIFSGLKSMPSVQGRSYSTTETYAGVAYDIIIRNTRKYQRACKRMIEAGYWLIAALNGEQPRSITLEFRENKTLHRLHTAQAEQIELRNSLILWETGIIDQIMFGQRFGYAAPVRELELPPKVSGQPDTTTETTPGTRDTASPDWSEDGEREREGAAAR